MGPVSIGVEVQRNTDGDTPSTVDREDSLTNFEDGHTNRTTNKMFLYHISYGG